MTPVVLFRSYARKTKQQWEFNPEPEQSEGEGLKKFKL